MKQALVTGLIGLLAGTVAAAASTPQDKVVSAAKQLAGKPNYSWTTTMKEGGARRREGQDPPKIENPKGSVKFWIQGGVLTQYEINVQGKVTAGERELDVNRTATIEIKDAGSTRLEVPAEAKQKML